MITHTMKIDGMTCNGCANRVARALKEVPGVSEAKVSLVDGTAEVNAQDEVEAALLVKAVEKKGYSASLAH